jgi:hypothetical protein
MAGGVDFMIWKAISNIEMGGGYRRRDPAIQSLRILESDPYEVHGDNSSAVCNNGL